MGRGSRTDGEGRRADVRGRRRADGEGGGGLVSGYYSHNSNGSLHSLLF